MTDQEKVKILISFNVWVGGGLPSHHYWESCEDDFMAGKTFWIEDNTYMLSNKKEALTSWFEKLDEDTEDVEVKSLIKKFPKLKKEIGYLFK